MYVAASLASETPSPLEHHETEEALLFCIVKLGFAHLELIMATDQTAKRNFITYTYFHSRILALVCPTRFGQIRRIANRPRNTA